MMMRSTWAARLAVVTGLAAAAAPAFAADAMEDFYKGKTITIVVGNEAGGAYDLYARLIGKYLPKYLAGKPNVIVQNMPGASTLTAANHVFNVAPQDGTFIAATNGVLPFQPLLEGGMQVKFDPVKAQWLPTPNSETYTTSVWHTVPIMTFLDARNRETLMGSTGQTSSASFFARVFNDVFHTKFKLILGYKGSSDQFLAMERGEIDGHASATWVNVKNSYPEWLRDKKLRLLLHYGSKPNPELADVPFARDLAENEQDRQFLDLSMASTFLGRPYMMGPAVPGERFNAVAEAFMASFADPAFIEDAGKQKLDVSPLSAAEVRTIISNVYAAPLGQVERLRRISAAKE
jgi:tripartite-type tricarboxylate transporter receptor subunit TctC